MRILLLNPAHPAVASRCHKGQMPPLGLLMTGGPLIDAGHDVSLLDAEIGPLTTECTVNKALDRNPEVVLIGHAGSTSAHPGIVEIAKQLKAHRPDLIIIYGGVYPTYHATEILNRERCFDLIVRGEGEATALSVMDAIEKGAAWDDIPGIAFVKQNQPVVTLAAPVIRELDAYRVGWELIENWDAYQYWGAGRAAVIQFSRGCPHLCSYCGQRGFWTRWRYRDPEKIAAEIGWLYREHNVRFVDLADENPTTSRRLWKRFLEALIAENVPVQLVGTLRATDIVRDQDILPLYRDAGFSRILMGIETTDADTLVKIRKGTTTADDLKAVQLLREVGILSQLAYIVGFEEQTDRDFIRGIRQLLAYDPDQVNAMYVTPHRWTPFFEQSRDRYIVEDDLSKWDYRHQVLSTGIPPWRVFMWVKLTEAILQLRPRALWRIVNHPFPETRRALRWCYSVGRKAWLFEVGDFLKRCLRPRPRGLSLARFWNDEATMTEESMTTDRALNREPKPVSP